MGISGVPLLNRVRIYYPTIVNQLDFYRQRFRTQLKTEFFVKTFRRVPQRHMDVDEVDPLFLEVDEEALHEEFSVALAPELLFDEEIIDFPEPSLAGSHGEAGEGAVLREQAENKGCMVFDMVGHMAEVRLDRHHGIVAREGEGDVVVVAGEAVETVFQEVDFGGFEFAYLQITSPLKIVVLPRRRLQIERVPHP